MQLELISMKARSRRTSGSCVPQQPGHKPLTYAEVVAKYLAEDQARGDKDLAWYAEQPDFETLLEKAAMCRARSDKPGKERRHPHQRRIPESVLRQAHRALARCKLESCRSFVELHELIEKSAGRIKGIGPLTVFDIACRIGAWKKPRLLPKAVYLHSGTRAGAAALGLGSGQKTLDVHELPPEFHCLSGRHAEDCLCIHKDALKQITSSNGQ